MVTSMGAETLPFLSAFGVLPASLAFFVVYNKLVRACCHVNQADTTLLQPAAGCVQEALGPCLHRSCYSGLTSTSLQSVPTCAAVCLPWSAPDQSISQPHCSSLMLGVCKELVDPVSPGILILGLPEPDCSHM